MSSTGPKIVLLDSMYKNLSNAENFTEKYFWSSENEPFWHSGTFSRFFLLDTARLNDIFRNDIAPNLHAYEDLVCRSNYLLENLKDIGLCSLRGNRVSKRDFSRTEH